jgi:hypothetical protein
MLRFFMILFAIVLGASPSHSQMAMPILRGDNVPDEIIDADRSGRGGRQSIR